MPLLILGLLLPVFGQLPDAQAVTRALRLPDRLEPAVVSGPQPGVIEHRAFRMPGSKVLLVQLMLAKAGTRLDATTRAQLEAMQKDMEARRQRAGAPASDDTDLSIRFPGGRRGYLGAMPSGDEAGGMVMALFETADRQHEVLLTLLFTFESKEQANSPPWKELVSTSLTSRLRQAALEIDAAMSKH